ncbi:MAG: asparagine synthase (glutamine-hydrolyzing) [Deltaproteobacteria bacterium]|nr:asparagine synthase (glutamine-hydrolyzing) [Deltaproteobacteria bacterium]MBW2173174.1 asparagine synthase (glutamine-hydrolyzing) [Deltaproteobacteria bacterium]
MCGICGIVNIDRSQPVSPPLLEGMALALAHRGPDDQQIFADRFAGLGHRRLAIIDCTPRAQQPMSNEDGSIWITCNGEIYNYKACRGALESKGHRFKSRSDTEVILHLYEDHGENCLQYLRGMFAFGIWDKKHEKLFLARDRLGQKPIYYTLTPERFLFASEIKALLQDVNVPREPNLKALHHYLSLSYVPGSETAFQNIHKLPPAHKLIYENGKVHISCYWHLSYAQPPENGVFNADQVQHEIIERLRESVELRLMSDVPLGAFLSGGIDSSTIIALMTQLTNRPVKTFTVAFNEKSHDESASARSVAEFLGTDHHEYSLTPRILDSLPEILDQYDEPFADPSAVSTYYLAQMAQEHITVALNGDGGDESFAGYDRYAKNKLADYYYRIPPPFRKTASILAGILVPKHMNQDHLSMRLRHFFQLEKSSLEKLYCRWLLFFNQQDKRTLYTKDFAQNIHASNTEEMIIDLMHASDGKDITEKSLNTDVLTYLPDCLLIKMDRATMAHSMENRSPFLDHTFMEYVAGLPAAYKLKGLIRKWILKKATGSLLPRRTIHQAKRGFGIPVDQWLRHHLKDMAYDTLTGRCAKTRGYFDQEAVKNILDQHMSGRQNWQFHLWNLLVLELWHQKFIDDSGSLPYKQRVC